MNNLHKSSSF